MPLETMGPMVTFTPTIFSGKTPVTRGVLRPQEVGKPWSATYSLRGGQIQAKTTVRASALHAAPGANGDSWVDVIFSSGSLVPSEWIPRVLVGHRRRREASLQLAP